MAVFTISLTNSGHPKTASLRGFRVFFFIRYYGELWTTEIHRSIEFVHVSHFVFSFMFALYKELYSS